MSTRPGLPPPDALGPDEELVAGRRPVEEAFVARRPARRLLVVPQRRQALEKIVLHATNLRIPIVEVEGGSLTALAGFDGHQGVALVVEPRVFATIDDILARAAERGEPPLILVLDSLEDPHNVGSLLRSAEGAGVHGVLFPVKRQAPLTPSAIKASAGAVEHLLLCPVDDLASALVDLHSHGIWVAGADGDAPLTARQTDLRGPLALVVGSEGQGLGPAVRKRCDLFVRIPLKGAIGSLNAAVAGSVLLFEVAAQRDPDGTSTRPAARNVQVATPAPDVDATPVPVVEPETSVATTTEALDAPASDPETVPSVRPKRTVVRRSAPKGAAASVPEPVTLPAADPAPTAAVGPDPIPAPVAAPKPERSRSAKTAATKPTKAASTKPTKAAPTEPAPEVVIPPKAKSSPTPAATSTPKAAMTKAAKPVKAKPVKAKPAKTKAARPVNVKTAPSVTEAIADPKPVKAKPAAKAAKAAKAPKPDKPATHKAMDHKAPDHKPKSTTKAAKAAKAARTATRPNVPVAGDDDLLP